MLEITPRTPYDTRVAGGDAKRGDVVCLRSVGHVEMTVAYVDKQNEIVKTIWLDRNNQKTVDEFSAVLLDFIRSPYRAS